jgi:hypothetical protein
VGGERRERREVKLYCLAEIFRAGATETGIVKDDDCLPSGIVVTEYHERLAEEAQGVLAEYATNPNAKKRFPWYLLQQVFLYLAARNGLTGLDQLIKRWGRRLELHQAFCAFLLGKRLRSVEQRSIFTVMAVSAFGNDAVLDALAGPSVSPKFLKHLSHTAPSVAMQLWQRLESTATPGQSEAARQSGLVTDLFDSQRNALPAVAARDLNPFLDEQNLLSLGQAFIQQRKMVQSEIVSPWQIEYKGSSGNKPENQFPRITVSDITLGHGVARASAFFEPPDWCDMEDRKRFELGQILRFALRGSMDFHSSRRPTKVPRPSRFWA